jgi:DNA-binding transcriptional regulator YhcF (GntR family)
LQPGEQLRPARTLAEAIVTKPSTVAKAYRESGCRKVIDLRQGVGASVPVNSLAARQAKIIRQSERLLATAVGGVRKLGLSEATMRRVFEAKLSNKLDLDAEVPSRG